MAEDFRRSHLLLPSDSRDREKGTQKKSIGLRKRIIERGRWEGHENYAEKWRK